MSSADVTMSVSLASGASKMSAIKPPSDEAPTAAIPFEVANFKPIEVDLEESSDPEANKDRDNSGHHTSSSASSRSSSQHVTRTSAANEVPTSHRDEASTATENKPCSLGGDNNGSHQKHSCSGSGTLRPGHQIGHAFHQLRRTFTVSKKSPKEASPDTEKSLRQSRSLGESKKTAPAVNMGAAAFARGVSSTFQYVVKHVKKGAEGAKKTDKGDKSDQAEHTIPEGQENEMMGKVTQQGRTVLVQGFSDMPAVVRIGEQESVTMGTPIMITKCSNTTFEVAKKCNKLEIDSCKNCRITFHTVISSVDMQNSESCEVFCTGGCPGVNLDSVTSCRVHIPRSAVEGINISSSGGGSAAIVIAKPEGEDGGDMDEYQIPFQYVHKFKEGQLVSEVSPLYYH